MLHYIVALNSLGNRLRRLAGLRHRATVILSSDTTFYRGQRVICRRSGGELIHGRIITATGRPRREAVGHVLQPDCTARLTRYRRSTLRRFAQFATEALHA